MHYYFTSLAKKKIKTRFLKQTEYAMLPCIFSNIHQLDVLFVSIHIFIFLVYVNWQGIFWYISINFCTLFKRPRYLDMPENIAFDNWSEERDFVAVLISFHLSYAHMMGMCEAIIVVQMVTSTIIIAINIREHKIYFLCNIFFGLSDKVRLIGT